MNYNLATFRNMGEKIVQGRKSKKMSQAAFIEALSAYNVQVGRNRLSKIENGVRNQFDLEFMIAACDIFGWDMGYLLGEYEERTKKVSDICTETGLTEHTVNLLVALNQSKSIMAPFRKHIINRLLESKIFWEEIVEHMQSAYLTLCGIDGELEGDDRKAFDQAVDIIKEANLGGVTKYTVYKGRASAPLQVQCAANAAQTVFRQIIDLAVAKGVKGRNG